MVNFLAFLGWSPGTEEEIFTLDELAERFEIGEVHKGGAVFDKDRLDYLNGVYIRSLADEQLALRLRPWVPEAILDDDLLRLVPLIKERLVQLGDAAEPGRLRVGARRGGGQLVRPGGPLPEEGGPDEARAALGRARHARRARRCRLLGGRAGAALPRRGRRPPA